jgi:flagellar motor switch protein FliG
VHPLSTTEEAAALPEQIIDDLDARARVAVLMIALGQETTAEVMKYM